MAFACNGRRKLASRGREHRTPKRTKNGGCMPPKFIRNYWSKKTHNDSKSSLLVKNYQYNQKLFYLSSVYRIGLIATEDEELIIFDNLIGHW